MASGKGNSSNNINKQLNNKINNNNNSSGGGGKELPEGLRKDKEYYSKASNLEGGALLTELETNSGRVIFSLQELPLRTQFRTPNNNLLQRTNEELIKLISPTEKCGCLLKLTRSIDQDNKDILIWAQYQSDLSTVTDEHSIRKNGIHLRDIYTGLAIRVHSLTELSLGVKYFTENDNLLFRSSPSHVTLGDKLIEICKVNESLNEGKGDHQHADGDADADGDGDGTNAALKEAEYILDVTPGLDPSSLPRSLPPSSFPSPPLFYSLFLFYIKK